jgi:hypothetical protein
MMTPDNAEAIIVFLFYCLPYTPRGKNVANDLDLYLTTGLLLSVHHVVSLWGERGFS